MKNFLRPIFGGGGMPEGENVYHEVLGIPVSEQPPNLYRLLDLPLFEADEESVQNAARIRSLELKNSTKKIDPDVLKRLVEEINTAKQILSDKEKRAQYDKEYRASSETDSNPESELDVPVELVVPEEPIQAAHSDLIGNQLLEALAKENATLKARSNDWISMSVEYQKQLEAKDQEILNVRQQLELLTATEQRRTESLNLQQDNFRNDLQVKHQEIQDRDVQIEKLTDQNQKMQSDLNELISDFEKIEKQNKSLIAKFKVAGPKIKSYKSEIQNLQEQLSNEANNRISSAKASSEQKEEVAALKRQLELLTEKLTSSASDFEKQKQTLLDDNAQLKLELSKRVQDDLVEVASKPKAAADSIQKVNPIVDRPKDELSEFGVAPAPSSSRDTQIKKPVFSDSINQFPKENSDSRNTNSSLVALGIDETGGQLESSSLFHVDDEDTELESFVRFRIRDRLGGNVVLDNDISEGDCIKIGRLSDYCTFDVIAKRLSSDRVLSGRHFQLDFTHDSVTVKDVGSTNGTLAAGELLKGQEKTIAFRDFKDSFFKIRAGELFQFEMELIEVEIQPAPKASPAVVAEKSHTDGLESLGDVEPEPETPSAAKGQPGQPVNNVKDEESLSEMGFVVEPDKEQPNFESNSRDSLEWDE